MQNKSSFKSSVETAWSIVNQIIHFSNWNKRTIENIITSTIKQGEFTKFQTTNNVMRLINTQNVDCIEVFSIEK